MSESTDNADFRYTLLKFLDNTEIHRWDQSRERGQLHLYSHWHGADKNERTQRRRNEYPRRSTYKIHNLEKSSAATVDTSSRKSRSVRIRRFSANHSQTKA